MNFDLIVPVDTARDHIRGPLLAPITLLEYGDYQCKHCGAAQSTVDAIQLRLDRHLRFVYRHMPLVATHPRAELAAEAAEAAGAQGEFWTMHDTLFANQRALEDDDLLAYAAKVRIDAGRFGRELAARTHRARVREDVISGTESGVLGTPTFFINGARHVGGYNEESLLAAIERIATARTRVRAIPPRGW